MATATASTSPLTRAPTVLKIGGSLLDDQPPGSPIWAALAELGRRPGGLAIVHGGGKAVDRQLDRLGMVSERREGLRITTDEHMPQVVAMLAGVVNKAVVASLSLAGARAVGISLSDGGLCRASKLSSVSFDPGRVGSVTGGDPALFQALAGAGFLAVVSSIGIDAHGGFLNINADDAAAGLARVIGAGSLVLLTDVSGIRGEGGTILPEVATDDVERLIERGVIGGGMIAKARAAAQAATQTGAGVVILSGAGPEPLMDWIAGRPTGTTVYSPSHTNGKGGSH